MRRKFNVTLLAVFPTLLALGCGTNVYEKEMETDVRAVEFAREVKRGGYDVICAEELKVLIDKKTPMVLVDAMPYESSYKKGHIPGAKQFLFPKEHGMADWDDSQTEGKSKEDYKKLLGDDKDKLIVVYCGYTKCLRSHNAAVWAKKLEYTNVKRFPGGIYAWKGNNFPTATK